MGYTTKLVEFDNGISLCVDSKYDSFLYSEGRKNVTLTFYMINESGETGYFSASGVCKIDMLSKSFALPSGFLLPAGRTELIKRTVTGVLDASYPEYVMADVQISYTSAALGELSAKTSVSVRLGKMYYAPQLAASLHNISLGDAITFSGDMLDQDYMLYARIQDLDGNELGFTQIYDQSSVLMTYPEWIERVTDSSKMSAYIYLSASFGSQMLPSEQIIPITLYLDEKHGTPRAAVKISYSSDYAVINGLGYGVKNRSSCTVEVTDMVCAYGASVSSFEIVYRGISYPMMKLSTGILTEAGQEAFLVRIKDSRGFIFEYPGVIEVRNYAPPEFNAVIQRSDKYGKPDLGGTYIYSSLTITKGYELDGNNRYTSYYTYAPVTATQLIERVDIEDGMFNLQSLALDPVVSYEVVLYCEDLLGSVVSRRFLLESERVELNIAKNRVSVGKYASGEYAFESAWKIKSDADIEFTDEQGRRISLSEQYSGGFMALMYKECAAIFESDIEAALAQDKSTPYILILDVKSEGLSYSKGKHALLVIQSGSIREL